MCESKRMVRDGQVERGEEAAKADVATHHAATAIQGFDGGSFQDRCECGRGTRTPWGRRTRHTCYDLPWTRTPPAVSIRDTRPTFTEPLPTSAHAAPLARARLRNQIIPCWARAAPRRRLIAAERPDTPVHAVVGMALAVAAPVAAALNGALVTRRDLAAGAGSGRRGRTGLTEGTLHVVRVVTFARAPATRVRRGRWKGRGGRVIARLARGVGRALPGDRGTGRKRKGKGECQEEQTGVANTQSHLAVVVVGRESWRASC